MIPIPLRSSSPQAPEVSCKQRGRPLFMLHSAFRIPRSPFWIRRCLAVFVSALLASSASALTFSTVVIDAGHGGRDGGAVWNGLIEKKLSLDVAKRLQSALARKGLRVVMTRSTDSTVELSTRARRANAHPRSVFVSIHFNACRDRSVTGIETHYRSERGRTLARAIQRSMTSRKLGVNRGIDWEDFKVLRETKMPAALVECGFISNKTEARRCSSPAHRQALADAIAAGILAARG